MRERLLPCLAAVSCLLGCRPAQPTETEIPDEGLEDGELTGHGPGGVGALTLGMAKADPKVVEAEALLADGKAAEALEVIDAAIADKPTHSRFHFVRGNALSYLDRDDEAIAAYQKAVELDPEDGVPRAAIGNIIAFRDGATMDDKRAAVDHFQAALKLDPELHVAHQALGVVLIALEQYQQAVEALENSNRLSPTADTAYLLAQVYGELGNVAKALEHAASALEFEPDARGVDLRLLYARLLMRDGQSEEAARQFERCGKLVPDSPPLRLEVARGLLEIGQADAAMVHMEWLVSVAPQEVPVIVNHARVLVAQGKAKEAIARFDEALAIKADSQAAQTYKIQALVAAKQCKAARKAYAGLAAQLGWSKGEPLPRALAKAEPFLAPCK